MDEVDAAVLQGNDGSEVGGFPLRCVGSHKALFGEMLIEGDGLLDSMAMHAVETRQIDQA